MLIIRYTNWRLDKYTLHIADVLFSSQHKKIEQQNRINTNVINDHNNTLLQFHSVL